MIHFNQTIQRQCQIFTPFLDKKIEISSDVFIISKGKISDFVQEIKQTGELAIQQDNPFYVEYYTQRLIQQFDTLKNSIEKYQKREKEIFSRFKTRYQFAKNINKLPASKQPEEYRKILRALNEKLSWLIELSHQITDEQQKQSVQEQIKETEYRLRKCSEKISELE